MSTQWFQIIGTCVSLLLVYLKSQNFGSEGLRLTCFLEYVVPLAFPSHTS